ncbi:hypothetical protein BH10PLA2_BH10PLA2_30380 [soil metagenome]
MMNCILFLLMVAADGADYARPDMLTEASALAKGPTELVVDVRSKKSYLAGHIPGAVWVDAAAWGKAFKPDPDIAAWGKRLGDAGIDLNTHIVLCGGDDVREAARIWWILRYCGVKDVRLLNGGWSAWLGAGGKVEQKETRREPRAVELSIQPDRLATKDNLLKLLKVTSPQIVDARSSGEFCGDATTARRNGSIPGATHLEWTECLDPHTKRFKTPAELQKLLREHNIDVSKPAVTYCQSGGRASVMAFTLELMGGRQVQNYYQSWSEWGNDPDTPIVKPAPTKPASQQPTPIAVTSTAGGKVLLLDRGDLRLLRTVEPDKQGPARGAMHVLEDTVRRVFYVGNFNGGLGRIPMDGAKPDTLDLGGILIGLAISPDGRFLAVNGAHDLTLRLVDLDSWNVKGKLRFGTPSDAPLHIPLTHGMASTHPVWLQDGSGVLVQDNIHEEVVLVGRDGKEKARRRLPAATHTFLNGSAGEILALVEGTIDGKILPSLVALALPSLEIIRETTVPLAPGEPAKLHHGSLSPDGEIVVVANMGPMHGQNFGTTVAAVHRRTGKVLWHVPTVHNAGHVRFLDAGRVVVLGHRDAKLAVLDVKTGQRKATWEVPGATALGHALAGEAGGTVLLIDSSASRLVRVGSQGVVARSSALGEGVSEASLPE